VGKGIVEMEVRRRVRMGGRDEGPTTTEGERRGRRRKEGKAGEAMCRTKCFLRA